MTKFYQIGNNEYQARHSTLGLRQGKLKDVVQFMVFDIGIEYDQIETALINMNELSHDAADFGIFGKFIFSFSKGKNNAD